MNYWSAPLTPDDVNDIYLFTKLLNPKALPVTTPLTMTISLFTSIGKQIPEQSADICNRTWLGENDSKWDNTGQMKILVLLVRLKQMLANLPNTLWYHTVSSIRPKDENFQDQIKCEQIDRQRKNTQIISPTTLPLSKLCEITSGGVDCSRNP